MATAAELLAAAAIEDEILVVNPDTRIISIPGTVTLLGVESDDEVKRLYFTIPRYYGEFDLSEFVFRINFKNARNLGDVYDVADKVVDDSGENITFSWLVDRSAFQSKGDVTFSLCLKLYDDDGNVIKEWNTTFATLPVLPGLETSKTVVEKYTTILDQVLFRLYAVEAVNEIGRDGHYSIVTMTESDDDSGVVFRIVNQDGELEAIVKHGKDGYTPVYGVDYWTPEQEAEIKTNTETYAKNYVDSWAPRNTTATLVAANWTDNTQTVAVEEVGLKDVVIVAPEPSTDNYTVYNESQVRCISQHDGSLTFWCDSVPAVDLVVNISVIYVVD